MPRTEKEVYLGLAKGELPDYVPMGNPYKDRLAPVVRCGPEPLYQAQARLEGAAPDAEYKDLWGVTHTPVAETNYTALPKPGDFILPDITQWDRYIKNPTIPDDFDWEKYCADQLKPVDRSRQAVTLVYSPQVPFQQMMAFMGFTEGLIALYEEPEASRELLNYLTDYYVSVITKALPYWKPELLNIPDDTASKLQPFFSLEVYRDLFKPCYARMAQPALDAGADIAFHNCGRCEDFVGDMVDFGVKFWNPAQPQNDLNAIKAKYYDKYHFTSCGGWENIPGTQDAVTEAEIRQKVRDTIDLYAPGGGYVFGGGYLGTSENTAYAAEVAGWISDEVYEYGSTFYTKKTIL